MDMVVLVSFVIIAVTLLFLIGRGPRAREHCSRIASGPSVGIDPTLLTRYRVVLEYIY
jgi:hypothetical protein